MFGCFRAAVEVWTMALILKYIDDVYHVFSTHGGEHLLLPCTYWDTFYYVERGHLFRITSKIFNDIDIGHVQIRLKEKGNIVSLSLITLSFHLSTVRLINWFLMKQLEVGSDLVTPGLQIKNYFYLLWFVFQGNI